MPRPPLPIGAWGSIATTSSGGVHTARARFRDFDGVTRLVERTSSKSKGDAENILRKDLADRTLTSGTDEITAETTIEVITRKWFDEEIVHGQQREYAYNTVLRYGAAVDLIVAGLGQVRLREATVQRVDAFIVAAARSSAANAKAARTVLQGVLGMASRVGAIKTNPIRDTRRVRVDTPEVKTLSIEQVNRIRELLVVEATVRQRDGDLLDPIDMFMATGGRIGAVLALRWDQDIDLDNGTATLSGTVIRKSGQGLARQPFTKTHDILSVLLPEYAIDMLGARKRTDALVFPSLRGGLRDPNNLRKQWRHAIEGTEFEGWVTPHTFRKTVAEIVGPDKASAQLGHRDPRTTRRHYLPIAHFGPDARAELQAVRDLEQPTFTQRKRASESVKVQRNASSSGTE